MGSFPWVILHLWLRVVFNGMASHAGQYPWDGVNALDAAVGAYVNVSMLRQQMKPDCRVHGVIKRGGLSSNVIPDETEMEYRVRAPTTRELVTLTEKVKGCFLAAAEATGCTVAIDVPTPIVKHIVPNETLARVFQKHGESLGMRFIDADPADNIAVGASTDAGNASHVVPFIHPLYDIGTKALNHSKAFTEAAGTEAGHRETLKAAKALCFTVLDVLGNEKLLKDIKEEFHAEFNSTRAEKK
ncbi:peptidase M20 domain-containing protein 2 [Ixodes scapularis]